jgi:hypothetical protein
LDLLFAGASCRGGDFFPIDPFFSFSPLFRGWQKVPVFPGFSGVANLFLLAFLVDFWLFLGFAEVEGPFSRELGGFFWGILPGSPF